MGASGGSVGAGGEPDVPAAGADRPGGGGAEGGVITSWRGPLSHATRRSGPRASLLELLQQRLQRAPVGPRGDGDVGLPERHCRVAFQHPRKQPHRGRTSKERPLPGLQGGDQAREEGGQHVHCTAGSTSRPPSSGITHRLLLGPQRHQHRAIQHSRERLRQRQHHLRGSLRRLRVCTPCHPVPSAGPPALGRTHSRIPSNCWLPDLLASTTSS